MAERLAVVGSAARARTGSLEAARNHHAGLGIRLLAYLLDSVVLFAFTMVFAAIAFLNIFLNSDSGRVSASDSAIWISVVLLMLTFPAWGLLNLYLTSARAQTMGQFILGLKLEKDEGGRPGPARLALYWLALHPLLFHPLLAAPWVLLAYVSLQLSESTIAFVGSLAVGLLCLVGPFVSLLMAAGDSSRRAIHDRIAGILVSRIE